MGVRVAMLLSSLRLHVAQQPGQQQAEVHPPIWTQECHGNGQCQWQRGSLVLDANWRWINRAGTNCYTNDNTWDPSICHDPTQCARECAVEGADYAATYGVSTTTYQDGLLLKFVTHGSYSTNYGSRLYLLDDDEHYKMFHLLNREFTLDVDVSQLPCGLNGAVYFVEMDQMGDYNGDSNKAGAKYGTGYCDAQCPHDIKFISGEANMMNWNSTHVPPIGHYGACCAEMDIFEANSHGSAYTPHPCERAGLDRCEGASCGDNAAGERYDGVCDKDGCDFNSFRMGATNYYGRGSGYEVDTTRPFTVVTQFITHDGTDTGSLSEIRRFYVQDGREIPNSAATVLGGDTMNSVTDSFCSAQKQAFGDVDDFTAKGGLAQMGAALGRGMVLVLSLWDDTDVNMAWLDSAYPTNRPPRMPGVLRGPCPGGSDSTPEFLRANKGDSQVTFSGIRVGEIGSTTSVGRRLEPSFI